MLEAGGDHSLPDVEMGALDAAEEHREYSDDNSGKHPDKLVASQVATLQSHLLM